MIVLLVAAVALGAVAWCILPMLIGAIVRRLARRL